MSDDATSTGHDDAAARLAHARERALLDEVAGVRDRMASLEARIDALARLTQRTEEHLQQLRTQHRQDVARLSKAVANRRIDRQLRAAAGKVKRAIGRLVRPGRRSFHVAVVCPVYPGGDRSYGGEFVRARVRLYREAGATVTVFVVRPGGTVRHRYDHEGVTVIRIDPERLVANLEAKAPDVVAVHHLTPPVWEALRAVVDAVRLVVWVHGYEARDWRELESNLTPEELEARRDQLDAANAARRATMAEAFGDERISFVFVSQFMRDVAERFAGRPAIDGRVIPNVIDERRFPYREKDPEDRRQVLWLRSFAARNYANDLSRDAILALAERDGFDRLAFTVVGDGKEFEEIVAPLRGLPNVSISRGFVSTEAVRQLHEDHGVLLVPTRWDSQGLTCGEAMSSGLVPVTNRVAAIPEFVPEDAGILCPPDDAAALADAIERLQQDPDLFRRMSARASRSIRAQCGRKATVRRELKVLDPRFARLRRVFGR